jgi:hypothetical protein
MLSSPEKKQKEQPRSPAKSPHCYGEGLFVLVLLLAVFS